MFMNIPPIEKWTLVQEMTQSTLLQGLLQANSPGRTRGRPEIGRERRFSVILMIKKPASDGEAESYARCLINI